MSNISKKEICLILNSQWRPTGYKNVKDTITSMAGPDTTNFALDIEYAINDDGTPDFSKVLGISSVKWENWINLPIRPWDLVISTPHRDIRVPTVVIATNHHKMPKKSFKRKPSVAEIRFRDGNIDQYTGLPLRREDSNIDHVIPKSRGGKDTWDNMVQTHKALNSKKGNKLNHEIGLKLIREPKVPRDIFAYEMIKTAKHRDWEHFIIK